jgi:hypothetical protein
MSISPQAKRLLRKVGQLDVVEAALRREGFPEDAYDLSEGGKHFRVTFQFNGCTRSHTLSGSPSDCNGNRALESQLRRILREMINGHQVPPTVAEGRAAARVERERSPARLGTRRW